jgi:UrcA family protein
MNSTIRTTLYAAICCAVGTAALCAQATKAQAEDAPPSKTVRFADLNIQNPEGAKVLYHRIRVAAAEVCHASAGTDPILNRGETGCINQAVDNAVRKVNAPYLTALRFGSSGTRLASQ